MSFKKYASIILLIFSTVKPASWYKPALNLFDKHKKTVAAVSVSSALAYSGYKLCKSRQKPVTQANPAQPKIKDGINRTQHSDDLDKILDDALDYYDSFDKKEIKENKEKSEMAPSFPITAPCFPVVKHLPVINPNIEIPTNLPKTIVISDPINPIASTVPTETTNPIKELVIASQSAPTAVASDIESKEKKEDYEIVAPEQKITYRDIQKFCDSFISNDYKLLADAIGINLTHYDIHYAPFLFEQLILENCKFIKQRIVVYNKFISDLIISEEEQIIWRTKFNKAIKRFEEIYQETGPWVIGKEIVAEIIRGNGDKYKSTPDKHITSMVLIVWYLHQLAVQKDQNFIEGTFNIQSKELYDFITSYQYRYPRSGLRSSHYREVENGNPNNEKWGIDIPQHIRKVISLPNNKFHILIGGINGRFMSEDNFTFMLKPEKYGIEIFWDKIGHTYEFVESVHRKFAGSNEQSHMRKEHLPGKYLEAFKNLYYSHYPKLSNTSDESSYWFVKLYNKGKQAIKNKITKTDVPQAIKDVTNFGIKAILYHARQLPADFTDEQRKCSITLENLLSEYIDAELRKGNEVIITKKEISEFYLR